MRRSRNAIIALACAIALAAQAVLFWSLVAWLPAAAVSGTAWAALYALVVLVALALTVLPSALPGALTGALTGSLPDASPGTRAGSSGWVGWARLAFYALFFALFFAAANFALDALHGAQRPKADIARQLGGLEVWFVLCPGVVSMALFGALFGALHDALQARRPAMPPS